jgi:molybdate transport system ATP-binding protein
MKLRCRIPLANFDLDVDTSFESRIAAIFGPSGSGKTTLLDAIAGLRPVTDGEIEIGGRTLFSSARGLNLPARRRGIGYVPQECALFPHFSVRKNVLFGAERGARAGWGEGISIDHLAEVLEIGKLLERPVQQLSGGEIQRVALARAILSGPRLLLLDEPLAALDVGLKERILPYLRRVRDEFAIPILYVTHDVSEVFALADWVIMIRAGRVLEQGAPREILPSHWISADPEQGQVENILNGRWSSADEEAGRSTVLLESGKDLYVPLCHSPTDRLVQVRIRGDDILLATESPRGISAANVFAGVVSSIEFIGGQAIVKVDSGDMLSVRLTAGAVATLGLTEGQNVFLIIKAMSCVVL